MITSDQLKERLAKAQQQKQAALEQLRFFDGAAAALTELLKASEQPAEVPPAPSE